MDRTYYSPQRLPRVRLGTNLRVIAGLIVLLSVAVTLSTGQLPTGQAATHASGAATAMDSYLSGLSARGTFSGAVLVARGGDILLSKGYGMANRDRHIRNTPQTAYPVGGVTSSLTYLVGLLLREQGKLKDEASICYYLTTCPVAWQPITVHMLLEGTSRLPSYSSGYPGRTPAGGLSQLQRQPLNGRPGSKIEYTTGAVLVLGLICEKASGMAWAALLQQLVFGPAGMTHSGRLTDALGPQLPQAYVGADHIADPRVYNDMFMEYASAPDLYAYDNAFYGGKLVSHQTVRTMLTPRNAAAPLNKIAVAHLGYYWWIGQVLGQRVSYTYSQLSSISTINMRFVQSGTTIVVISNDSQNRVEDIALHLARLVLG